MWSYLFWLVVMNCCDLLVQKRTFCMLGISVYVGEDVCVSLVSQVAVFVFPCTADCAQAEEKAAKLRQLEEQEARKLKEQEQWEKALKKAQGEKIKDDPKLLRKTLKREKKKKEKSKKGWEERKRLQEEFKSKEAEKKLQRHLKKKAGGKGGKKGGGARPGFEGRSAVVSNVRTQKKKK